MPRVKPPARAPERIRADEAAAILGVKVRTVQSLAARGELPGAAMIGRLWTFDELALRQWIRERSSWPTNQGPTNQGPTNQGPTSRGHRSTLTGGATRSGAALPLQAEKSAKAFRQALQALRRGESPP